MKISRSWRRERERDRESWGLKCFKFL